MGHFSIGGQPFMLLRKIQIKNLLSFGPNGLILPLRPLNVLIGPNGSGKSNFIEAIGRLQSAPQVLASPVRDGGGIGIGSGRAIGTPQLIWKL